MKFTGGAHGVKVAEDDDTLVGYAVPHGQPLHSDHAIAQSAHAGEGPVDREKQSRISDLEAQRVIAVANEDYETAARLRDEIGSLKAEGGAVSPDQVRSIVDSARGPHIGEDGIRAIVASQLSGLGDFTQSPPAQIHTVNPDDLDAPAW